MAYKRKVGDDDEDFMSNASKFARLDEADQPVGKTGRVRKKSTKVREMEEFEEAEKQKTHKKVRTPPEPSKMNLQSLNVSKPTATQQQLLQAANIQMNLMSTLKSAGTPMLSVQSSPESAVSVATLQSAQQQLEISSKSSTKKKKEEPTLQQIQQSDAKNKPLSRKNVLVVPGLIPNYPGVTTIEAGVIEQQMAIKDEPIESVDPNVLLPQQVVKSPTMKSPTLMHHLVEETSTSVKPTATVKSAKKGKGKQSAAEQSAKGSKSPSVTVKTDQSGSVIKMLLNKPAQFSDPVISTQTFSKGSEASGSTPKSETKSARKGSKAKKDLATEMLKVDTSVVKKEEGDSLMIPLGSVDSEHHVMGSPGKKQHKLSSPLKDDEDDDDDDDDLDDIDLDDDDVDDSMEWEFETQDGSLIIAEEETSPKSKKKPKKPPSTKKPKMKSTNLGNSSHSYSKEAAKEKKKKRLTAYTMWCNSVRNKVLNDNPGLDFAQLSRRLGEIWQQTISSKEKQSWKRKAKREARRLLGKGLLITTGAGKPEDATNVAKKKASPASATVTTETAATAPSSSSSSASHNPPPIHHPPIRHKGSHSARHVTGHKTTEDTASSTRHLGIEPIDTAAHLKLVGDSLSIIGMRLQEHRGLIAVQGTLSVLLDSMLCALGPLMCLTTQVPELHGCSAETHARTLDNIAYIMPGL